MSLARPPKSARAHPVDPGGEGHPTHCRGAPLGLGLAGGLGSIYLQSSLEWVLKQSPNFYQLMFCFAIIAAMMRIYKREFALERRKEQKENEERKRKENELSEEEMRQVQTAAANAARQIN